MKITPHYRQNINTCNAQKITTNRKSIYYLDEKGALNQVSLGQNNYLGRIINGKGYKFEMKSK